MKTAYMNKNSMKNVLYLNLYLIFLNLLIFFYWYSWLKNNKYFKYL